MLSKLRGVIPLPLLTWLLPIYHFSLALLGALIYRFPSKQLIVIGITGTKGKSSTAELLDHILEADGKKTALLGTIRFKIGTHSTRNLKKMTMPGRFFVQKFLRDAVTAGCTHAVIEMTSEGAKQFRHRFIDMDALIFTNLAPEHIEAHGSYEAYRDAKLSIARALAQSSKHERFMVANADDKEAGLFLAIPGVTPVSFGLADAENLKVGPEGAQFSFHGVQCTSGLGGTFNVFNMLGAGTCAMALGIPPPGVARGIADTTTIAGRMEHVEAGQTFPVIVDYAHTPDSLEAIYAAFKDYENICVLGNTGGGRDKWKRPVMGALADKYCREIILTNEDPYDEDPKTILNDMAGGIKNKTPIIILDRREAIAYAIKRAHELGHGSTAVLVTGKGTDPFIMGPHGTKTPWDDRTVTEEELQKLLTP